MFAHNFIISLAPNGERNQINISAMNNNESDDEYSDSDSNVSNVSIHTQRTQDMLTDNDSSEDCDDFKMDTDAPQRKDETGHDCQQWRRQDAHCYLILS